MKQSDDLRGPDRTRALRGSAIGLPPRRRHLDRGTAPVALTAARPGGWRACVSPLMRAHVSGPPADVAVFMATSTKIPWYRESSRIDQVSTLTAESQST